MAVHFSGTGSQRLDTIASFTPPSVGSVCVWEKSEVGALRMIGTNSLWEARISGSNMLHEFQQSAVPLFANINNAWEHWVFTYDGVNKSIFRNGVEVVSGASAHGTGGSSVLSIGSSMWSPAQSFKGAMEDVRIYNRVLSKEEVSTMYATLGTDGIVVGLLHRWMLTEGSENSAVIQAKDVIGGLDANPQGTGVAKYVAGVIRTRRKLN